MRRADVIAVALLCLGLVTACSDIDASSSSGSSGNTASGSVRSMSPSEARAADRLQWRMRWREDGAVDLSSPTGTFIRGVIEGETLLLFDWDVDGEFPGIKDAIPGRKDWMPPLGSNDYQTVDEIYKIADVRDLGDNSAVALVCTSGQVSTDEAGFPPYFDSENVPDARDRFVAVYRLTFHREGESPPESRSGPRLFPGYDVFGDWWVSEYTDSWAPPSGPDEWGREPMPDPTICGDMGDLTAPGPSYPGWSGSGV
ncbi:hypothetical protein GOAMI_03_01430 [Gordonia amicalis NBRC 100051 = JCM 11271]|nr:hypothetical protein GOAMI_03_01430 [Gordonia amicalis NBRC 100051 = JCM 11271]